MCKYFDFFVCNSKLNRFNWGQGGRTDFAQVGEEEGGRRQDRCPTSPHLVLTEILNLWRVRRKLFSNATSHNATVRVPKPLAAWLVPGGRALVSRPGLSDKGTDACWDRLVSTEVTGAALAFSWLHFASLCLFTRAWERNYV